MKAIANSDEQQEFAKYQNQEEKNRKEVTLGDILAQG
jgi:hypothetical protein